MGRALCRQSLRAALVVACLLVVSVARAGESDEQDAGESNPVTLPRVDESSDRRESDDRQEADEETDSEEGDEKEAAATGDAEDGPVEVPKVELEADQPAEDEETAHQPSATIESEQLERRGVTDLGEAMEWLGAGTTTSPTGTGTGLIVDGLPASQVTVLENGLPVSRRRATRGGQMVDLSAIGLEPEAIRRIEVYRGAGPAGSGGAGGVVINIVTRRERRAAAYGRARGGQTALQLHRREFAAGFQLPVGDEWFTSARASRRHRSALDINDDATFDVPRQQGWTGSAGTAWRPSKDESLRLRVDGSTDRSEALGAADSPLYDRVATRNLVVRLQGDWRPGDLWRLRHGTSVSLYDHAFHKIVRDSGVERLKADTEQLRGVQNLVATRFFASHELSLELYGSARRVRRTGGGGSLEPVDRGTVGVGVADTYFVTDDWRLSGRAYGDLSTEFGPGWTGELGTAVDLAEGWTTRLTLSRTRRLPTAEELYLFFDHSELGYQVRGNEALTPERLRSARLGLFYRNPERTVRAHLGGYYHRMSDLIDTRSTGSTEEGVSLLEYVNVTDAHSAGLNATLSLEELPGDIALQGNYAFLPVSHDLEGGERLPLRSVHSGRLELRREFFGERLEIWGDASTRSDLSVPDGAVAAPAYALLGFGVQYRPLEQVHLTVDANNLLDQSNATWGPKPGFNLLATLEVRYEAPESDPSSPPVEGRDCGGTRRPGHATIKKPRPSMSESRGWS